MISQTDMKSIGETFKLRRKELNISLKEAENATSIRASYLHSIEEGDVARLISPIYARGFLKQYATFLGIDGDLMMQEHPDLFLQNEDHEFSYGIGTLETRGNPGAGIKWFPNSVWVIASVVVIFLAWFLAHALELI